VLGVMRAETLEEAIDWQNATPFGLTAGLHTLDKEEQALWQERVQAGNIYINRSTTGAIVRRQPFGGWKRSSIGPGAKAGGPNYTYLFTKLVDRSASTPISDVEASYQAAWKDHYSTGHDPSALRCERNTFRYRPSRGVILRIDHVDERLATESIERAKLASAITGVRLTISTATEESEAEFFSRLPGLVKHGDFLRIVGPASDELLAAAGECELNWIDAPLTADGRTELRYWLREQSVSQTRHRYGLLAD
jgi:RHH-type proline utilization regulon transcriptional repressor/proline dehydrogenase/delta 1-pyrroline-5-carboxylate dehydrogenase